MAYKYMLISLIVKKQDDDNTVTIGNDYRNDFSSDKI